MTYFQPEAPFHTYVWILKDVLKANVIKKFDINNISLHWMVRSGFITFELLKWIFFCFYECGMELTYYSIPVEVRNNIISNTPRRCGNNNKAKELSSVACVKFFYIFGNFVSTSLLKHLTRKILLFFPYKASMHVHTHV